MVSEMESVKTNSVNNSAYLASQVTQHTARSVGVEFVRQYYTMLNVAPGLLYRFYSEDSTFVHGCLDKHGDMVQCIRGQKQINAKILSLNFKNCHTKIRQVDSVETINSGVVIQVIGELSNDGQPLRRFLQTFVLTPQTPNKYYVRNDIFRYHDEVFGEENEPPALTDAVDAKNESRSEPENFKQVEPAEKDSFTYQPNGTLNSSTTAVADYADTANVSADFPEDSQPAKESNTSTDAVNTSLVVDVSTESKDGNPEEETQLEQVSGGSAHIIHSSPLSNEPKTYASMLSKSFQAGTAPPALIPPPSKPVLAPVSSVTPAVVPTNSTAPSLNNVDTGIANDVTTVTAPPALTPKATGNYPPKRDRFIKTTYNNPNMNNNNNINTNSNNLTTNISNNNNRRNESRESIKNDSDSGEGDSSYNAVISKKPFPAPDDHQLFIGNLMPNFSEDELAEIFGRYGKIVDIRIHRQIYKANSKATRNYGFITFEDSSVVDQIVAQKPIFHGNHRYNVEKKQGRTIFNRDDRNRDERVRNNQLNAGNLSRNGSNLSNNPSTFQRHGPINPGGVNQGNYVHRPDRRPGQGYQNQGSRTFTGGQSYSNRNNFASGGGSGGGGHPQQNRS